MLALRAGCGSSSGLKAGAGAGEIVFPEAMFPMAEGFTTTHDNPMPA